MTWHGVVCLVWVPESAFRNQGVRLIHRLSGRFKKQLPRRIGVPGRVDVTAGWKTG